MVRIFHKEKAARDSFLYELDLPEIAKKARPGQFVILRVEEEGERIPLTIADYDPKKGTITVVAQAVGATTRLLAQKEAGEAIAGVAGPLGKPTHIEKLGTIICVGGGVGSACVYPIAREFKRAGNRVVAILGARSSEHLLFVDRFRSAVDELIIVTDDGSAGEKGIVTEPLSRLVSRPDQIDKVFAVGPVRMMAAVAELTRASKIPTEVSLNPIMVDGTGMCGGCRVTVGGKIKFACVDGPDFDAHQVDFEELIRRQRTYHDKESCRLRMMEGPSQ